jgi:hypothetical protein
MEEEEIMDIKDVINSIISQGRRDREQYHLTLGGLIDALENAPHAAIVSFDSGNHPGTEDSYRGYYEDLAFDHEAEPVTVEVLLQQARSALGATYEGYKGGDFTMRAETPLWKASYGCCGDAIVGIKVDGDVVTLVTREVA